MVARRRRRTGRARDLLAGRPRHRGARPLARVGRRAQAPRTHRCGPVPRVGGAVAGASGRTRARTAGAGHGRRVLRGHDRAPAHRRDHRGRLGCLAAVPRPPHPHLLGRGPACLRARRLRRAAGRTGPAEDAVRVDRRQRADAGPAVGSAGVGRTVRPARLRDRLRRPRGRRGLAGDRHDAGLSGAARRGRDRRGGRDRGDVAGDPAAGAPPAGDARDGGYRQSRLGAGHGRRRYR